MKALDCELQDGLLRVTLHRTPEPGVFAEALETFSRAHVGQDFRVVPVLIDARRDDLQTVPYDAVRLRADRAAALGNVLSRRWALVVSTPVHYGQGRQYSAFLGEKGIELRVFRDEGEALSWLGWEARGQ